MDQIKSRDKQNKEIKAKKEFEQANIIAAKASDAINEAKAVLIKHRGYSEQLKNWKSIMSTAPVVLFTIIFLIVSVGEYLISKEIYREFNESIPWLIAIVFFVAGIFVSEFLVYKIFSQKREWSKYELKRDPNNDDKTNDEIDGKIKRKTNNFFIFGLILGFFLLAAIGFLSYQRVVELNLAREASGIYKPFGVMDAMPIMLYLVELLSGAFVLYLIKQTSLSLRIKNLRKKFNKLVILSNRLTIDSIKKYQDAEREDYDPFLLQVSKNVQKAYYRHSSKTLDNKEEYLSLPDTINDVFNIHLTNKNGETLVRSISIITDYKFVASGSTNTEGRLSLEIEGTYPGDSCKHIFIKESDDSDLFITLNVAFDLDKDKVHEVIIN